ncbi:MAG: ATP-binding protein [Anaeroplasmataceae bacterium]
MYLTRYIEKEIKDSLETSGVVVVAGPKFCGKTTTSTLFANSAYSLNTKKKIELVQAQPEEILKGDTPRLIDEWQNVPDLWNCARAEVDTRNNKFGQFIFTGSSTPADMDEIYHTGSGRIVTVGMYPMCLSETNESKKIVSLSKLFKEKMNLFFINDNYRLSDTAFYICRGGWPLSLNDDKEKSLKITDNYCSTLFNFENNKNKKFRNKKPDIFKMLIRSYARNVSTEARRKTIISDINGHDDRNLDPDTFDSYLKALEDLYIIKDIEAWNPNFRSKTSIVTTPTRHFIDTSIAANALGMSPYDLINDPNTFGMFFEDFVVKELRVYASVLGGELRHYRDGNGLECDVVLHLKNGDYALIEVKLGGEDLINEGISNLRSLENKIIDSKQHLPKFKMIITAAGDAYIKDEIYIVPINLLTD